MYESINFSSLKNILESEKKFLMDQEFDTESLSLGRLVHILVLQPEKFNDIYEVVDLDLRKKEDKLIKEKLLELGKEIVKQKDFEIASNIVESIKQSKIYEVLTSYENKEIEKKLVGEINGIKFHGTPDFVCKNLILDVKTTQTAKKDKFKYSIRDYHYDMQAQIYQQLVYQKTGNILPYVILAIETKAPFHFNFYKLSNETMQTGFDKLNSACNKFLELKKKDFKNPSGYEFENSIGEI